MPVEGEQGIFEALYQWGKVKEDFYSNSLVYILKQLKYHEKERKLATNFLCSLLDGKLRLPSDDWDIRDHTGKDKRPDIEIESSDAIAIIEVKVDSPVNYGQLRRYRNKLLRAQREKGQEPTLCLLTAFGWEKAGKMPDLQISWVKIWEYLRVIEQELKPENGFASETYYLVRDFRLFLREEGMGVKKLSRNVTVKALDDLMKFLSIIRSGCMGAGLKPQWGKVGYWGEGEPNTKAIGWYFHEEGLRGNQYWCGFYLENPTTVSFEITGITNKALFARVKKDPSLKRRLKAKFHDWDLDEEWTSFPFELPKDFVSLSAEKQVRVISDFVEDVLNITKEKS